MEKSSSYTVRLYISTCEFHKIMYVFTKTQGIDPSVSRIIKTCKAKLQAQNENIIVLCVSSADFCLPLTRGTHIIYTINKFSVPYAFDFQPFIG
jgi:hypothetical protein